MKRRRRKVDPGSMASGIERIEPFIQPYRIAENDTTRLADYDPADTGTLRKREARAELKTRTAWMAIAQRALARQEYWSVLLILQGRDAAGKDSTIRHVLTRMNPQGLTVSSFGPPNAEELRHDFLWRHNRRLPARGEIGVFNRSYYEEVLVVRVHPEILDSQRLHSSLVSEAIWEQRLRDIRQYEDYLARNGTRIVKLFLHVSREEQKQRFLKRLDEPQKHWKFSASDIRDRQYWDAYTRAYEDVLCSTSRVSAPWYVVPADHKWFARLLTASIIVKELSQLDLEHPDPTEASRDELAAARRALQSE